MPVTMQVVQELHKRLAEQEGQAAQLRTQVKSMEEAARDGEATAAARVPELKRRIDELTAAQHEATSAARCERPLPILVWAPTCQISACS